ncbi:MAG: GNAT family N-acetyltransferase [Vulcanimicrobiaceae bacterium]
MPIAIRPANERDREAIWTILDPVVRAGQTYALPREMTRTDLLHYWFSSDHEVFVAHDAGDIIGTYFICPNQLGGGRHVANCGYATAERATGRGVARAMCSHSMDHARSRGFRSMQFNFVVSTNERAVRLWTHLGFTIVGHLPAAFEHPCLGYVDVFVMSRAL